MLHEFSDVISFALLQEEHPIGGEKNAFQREFLTRPLQNHCCEIFEFPPLHAAIKFLLLLLLPLETYSHVFRIACRLRNFVTAEILGFYRWREKDLRKKAICPLVFLRQKSYGRAYRVPRILFSLSEMQAYLHSLDLNKCGYHIFRFLEDKRKSYEYLKKLLKCMYRLVIAECLFAISDPFALIWKSSVLLLLFYIGFGLV